MGNAQAQRADFGEGESNSNPISEIQILQGHKDRIGWLVKIDDSRIATGSDAGEVIIWNYHSGQLVHFLKGHTLPITCLITLTIYEANNKPRIVLISSSSDKTIQVWDVLTGACLHVLKGHHQSVTCLTPIPDRQNIFCSAGNDR
jgi:WD40 repeat protein